MPLFIPSAEELRWVIATLAAPDDRVWWFGASWGASICCDLPHAPTPCRTICARCGEPIRPTDQGVLRPLANGERQAEHRVCSVRRVQTTASPADERASSAALPVEDMETEELRVTLPPRVGSVRVRDHVSGAQLVVRSPESL